MKFNPIRKLVTGLAILTAGSAAGKAPATISENPNNVTPIETPEIKTDPMNNAEVVSFAAEQEREMKIKKDLYAENGVREYWIVDFDHETLTRFKLEGEDRYGLAEIFVSVETVVSLVFPDLAIQLEELFQP